MPFVYSVIPAADFTTNSVAGTEIEAMFVKPGATRNVGIKGFYGGGKGTALTAISGIVQRLKKFYQQLSISAARSHVSLESF